MIRNIYHLPLIAVVASVSLASCTKWLEVPRKDEVPESKQFQTVQGCRDALTGAYVPLTGNTLYGGNLSVSFIEQLAQVWETPSSTNSDVLLLFFNHAYDAENFHKTSLSTSKSMFNILAQVNKVLESGCTTIRDEAERSVILGEAHALRAFINMDLMRLYGQLPQGGTKTVLLPYAKTVSYKHKTEYLSQAEFVQRIKEDLKKAEALLVNNDPISNKTPKELRERLQKIAFYTGGTRIVRLNYWAVLGLQARLALYLGEKQEAYAYAKNIIEAKDEEGKPVFKLSTLEDVDKGKLNSPSEALFKIPIEDVGKATEGLIWGPRSVDPSRIQYITKDDLENIVFKGKNLTSDVRFKNIWKLKTPISNSDASGEIPTIQKYAVTVDANDTDKLSSMDYKANHSVIPNLRLSEIYLIAIETTPDLAEANRLYVEFLRSKNVNPENENIFKSLDEVPAVVGEEYLREFIAEGQLFYYYKRTFTKDLPLGNKELKEDFYVIPLPEGGVTKDEADSAKGEDNTGK